MKNLYLLIIISLLLFTSCSTTKPTITDKDNKIKNSVSDYYKESNEEAYESMILENERKKALLGNKKNDAIQKSVKEEEEETLVATSKVKVTKEVVLNYINKYRAVAIDNMNNYNIPASITLAQGILESGCGTSTLSISANNHFGIKCHTNWEGESVTHTDDAPDECFRKYKNPRDSYRDHSLFLTSRKWYEPLFELNIKDYKAWSYGLKKSGYATDPKYPQKLISLIERYDLNQYDNFYEINKSPEKVTEKVETIKEIEPINVETTEKPLEITEKPLETTEKPLETTEKPLEISKQIDTNNQLIPEKNIVSEKTVTKEVKSKTPKTHTVEKGDTVYNISKRYNLSIEKLRTLNNIVESNISLGQVLIVE